MALRIGLGWDLSLNMDHLRAQAGPVREPRGSRSGTLLALLMSRRSCLIENNRGPSAMPRESRLEETSWASFSPARQVSAQSAHVADQS